jgi:hypothetical protein
MNRVNYSLLSWSDMVKAGWSHRVISVKGDIARVGFQTPVGGVEVRDVSVQRLPERDKQMHCTRMRPAPHLQLRFR